MQRTTALLAILLVGQAGAQGIPWAAHWRLDETSGTIARDTSPNQNNGTLKNFTGTPWGPGKIGNALTFDGVNDYVEVKLKRALPIYDGHGSPYSVTFWVKAPPQNDKRVYSEGNGQTGTFGGALFTLGSGRSSNNTMDKLQVYIRNDKKTAQINRQSNATVFDNKWHHVAWVDVAGKAVLYVDGVKDSRNFDYTGTPLSPTSPSYGKFTLDKVALGGVLRKNVVALMKGSLDDVRLYRFALTAADVRLVMKGGGHPPCRGSAGKYGNGCGAGPLDINSFGSPKPGGNMTFYLSKAVPQSLAFLPFNAGPASPLDLTPLGLKGCRFYPPLANMSVFGMGSIDSKGNSAPLKVPIPNNPVLMCSLFVFQGFTINQKAIEFSGSFVVKFGR